MEARSYPSTIAAVLAIRFGICAVFPEVSTWSPFQCPYSSNRLGLFGSLWPSRVAAIVLLWLGGIKVTSYLAHHHVL